jgi:uncharacterized protein
VRTTFSSTIFRLLAPFQGSPYDKLAGGEPRICAAASGRDIHEIENKSWPMMPIPDVCHLLSRSIPAQTPRDLFRRVRVLLYALLNPLAAHIWLKALRTDSLLADIAARNRGFLERPFRSFAQSDMPAYARAELLRDHFRVVRDLFGEDLVRRIYLSSESVTLAADGRYGLVVSNPVRCWREGLLTVAWRDTLEQVDLAWATISFGGHPESGKPGALIGGLQGPAGADRQWVREATRACHGLRPKAAVMEAVGEFCTVAKVDALTGVTKKTHVSAGTGVEFNADYDGFWRELGGVEVNGRFVLPLRPYHRDIGEVPSNRRAAFRRRQTLIANLMEQIDRAVNEARTADVKRPHQGHAKTDDDLMELDAALATN